MSENQNEPISIDYMPWADINEEFSIGDVSFWPFYRKAEEKIEDAEIREKLKQFFETFVDHRGRPVRTVVVCQCGEIGYRRFTDEEIDRVRAAVDCLIFAAIATGSKTGITANNPSYGPPSADRFDLCARWIWPFSDGVVAATESSMQACGDGSLHVHPPLSVGGIALRGHELLRDGLSCMLRFSSFPEDLRTRILRSLEWFRHAHTESVAVSPLQKIVMLTTAFEILLELPERGKKSTFIREIDERTRLDESILVTRRDGSGNEFQVGKAAEWAASLYELRSSIVHGDHVDMNKLLYRPWYMRTIGRTEDQELGPDDPRCHRWLTHLIVADMVLREVIMRMLFEHRCMGDNVRRIAAKFAEHSDETPEDFERAFLPTFCGFGFDDVHRAFGWLPPTKRADSEDGLNSDDEKSDS